MKFKLDPLPAALCFPKPPWRMDHSLVDSPPADADVAAYLDQIRSWRQAVLDFLAGCAGKPESEAAGLSERAREALSNFLKTSWPAPMQAWAAGSVFNVSAFPAEVAAASGNTNMDLALAVLRWRAGLEDYLDDVPTAMYPALELEECFAMGQFIYPSGKSGLCGYCLTEFGPEEIHPNSHDCLLLGHVRAKWPAMPKVFAHWAKEAKAAKSDTGADPSVQGAPETSAGRPKKRWWEVWK